MRATGGDAIARSLARLTVLALVGVVTVLVFALREAGLVILGAGLAGLAVCAVGVWWFVAYRGVVRGLGALVAVAAPVAVLVLFAFDGLWLLALLLGVCWAATLACARAALRRSDPERPPRVQAASRPRRPVLIMNPKSGGGKVGRFGLAERAEELGARVVLLDPSAPADVARSLEALADGEELRVDLGEVAGRAFVNTVSFGVYADVVQHPEYRDDKTGTALALTPDLLVGEGARRLDARVDGTALSSQQALLVSNDPYVSPDALRGTGRRPRLDEGVLGVLGIRVENAAQAADLAVRGSQSTGLTVTTARRVEVTSDTGEICVAVDGEALRMPVPVVCAQRPGALRVLVPRDRPGVHVPAPPVDWRRLFALAFGRAGHAAGGPRA